MRTIVAIGAHHDDVEVRCGGTLAKYIRQGWKAVYAVATTTPHYFPFPEEIASGKIRTNSEIIELRKSECRQAAAILGITDLNFFGFKSLYWYEEGTVNRRFLDGRGTTVEDFKYLMEKLPGREFIVTASHCPAAVEFLCDFLDGHKADVVLTHGPDDAHWEHYATALLVRAAAQKLAARGRKVDLYAWEPGGAGTMTMGFAPTHYVDISETIDLKCRSVACFTSQFEDHDAGLFARRARKKAADYGARAGMQYAEAFVRFQVMDLSQMDVNLPVAYDARKAAREL